MEHLALGSEALLSLIAEAVTEGGGFRILTEGKSMLPLLRPRRDAVILSAADRIERDDILLYRHTGGGLVLHRVRTVGRDGKMTLSGDNQGTSDRGVLREAVVAKVTAIIRDAETETAKELAITDARYLAYVKKVRRGYPLRRLRYLFARITGRRSEERGKAR